VLLQNKRKDGEKLKEVKEEGLPKNPIEAQGMLIKAMYEKFGIEALSIIREACKKQGRALGLKVRKKLPNNELSTVAKAFSKSYDPEDINIIQISNEVFQIQGNNCPFGLENTSRELCEAVMEIDAEYFRTAVDNSIELKILKTVAEGDIYCDTIYKLKQKKSND
jgi:predicted hydrocarbon binding protein